MGKAKITVQDTDGAVWIEEGELAFGAIGTRNPNGTLNIEIDFSSMSAFDISLVLATALTVATDYDKGIGLNAIKMFYEKAHKNE